MNFSISKIPLAETKQFSKLFLSYINNDNALKKYYTYNYSVQGFKNAIDDRLAQKINRKNIVEVITEQYKKSGIDSTSLNINALLDEKTFTVCTGHQLCLFTGPLYFIYKIISTINLSEKLKASFPDYNFVPVYWMASEDHDFDEVKDIHIFGKTLSWENTKATGAVGRLETKSLDIFINELSQLLGDSENAGELLNLFKNAYLNNKNLADATRYLVHQLMGKFKLIIIDGDDKRLKAELSSIVADDIINQNNYKQVSQTIQELTQIGIKPQVNPREINCFYLTDEFRERIEFDNTTNCYQVSNTNIKFSKEELLSEINNHPERYSPNVVLRPLYQQKILPNIAYVGGPGEIAYWLEYKAMFDFHKIQFPVLVSRNFSMFVDAKTLQQIQKLGFTINDFYTGTDELVKRYLSKHANADLSLNKELANIEALYSAITEKAKNIDITLKAFVEAEMQKTIKSISAIESKILRAEKQKHETAITQINKIKERLFPNGVLQERYDNFIPLYLKYGDYFIANLKANFNPFETDLVVLND